MVVLKMVASEGVRNRKTVSCEQQFSAARFQCNKYKFDWGWNGNVVWNGW